MDLILWRHAEAEDGMPDLERKLTKRGAKEAQRVADWLVPHLPKNVRILVSPAARTRQTAATLKIPFETLEALAPEASVADILNAAGWPSSKGTVVVVGHQPVLGQVAAWLLSDAEADWSIKKGALWWLSNRLRESEHQTLLRTVIAPEFL